MKDADREVPLSLGFKLFFGVLALLIVINTVLGLITYGRMFIAWFK